MERAPNPLCQLSASHRRIPIRDTQRRPRTRYPSIGTATPLPDTSSEATTHHRQSKLKEFGHDSPTTVLGYSPTTVLEYSLSARDSGGVS